MLFFFLLANTSTNSLPPKLVFEVIKKYLRILTKAEQLTPEFFGWYWSSSKYTSSYCQGWSQGKKKKRRRGGRRWRRMKRGRRKIGKKEKRNEKEVKRRLTAPFTAGRNQEKKKNEEKQKNQVWCIFYL